MTITRFGFCIWHVAMGTQMGTGCVLNSLQSHRYHQFVAYRTLQTHNTGSQQRNTRFIGYLSKLYLTIQNILFIPLLREEHVYSWRKGKFYLQTFYWFSIKKNIFCRLRIRLDKNYNLNLTTCWEELLLLLINQQYYNIALTTYH